MSKAPVDITKKSAQIITANEEIVNYLLSLNTNNRSLKKTHTAWLERAVRAEKFLLSNQAIGVSSEGVLIDGQHRLTAIRNAGYPAVEVVLVTGLDPELRLYLDQNAKRSVADALKIVLNETVTPRMTSVVSFLMKIEETSTGFTFIGGGRGRLGLDDVRKEVKKGMKLILEIDKASASTCRAGTLGALVEYARRWDEEDALELAGQVGFGENIAAGDPGYKLRDVVLKKKGRGVGGSNSQIVDFQQAVFCCIQHAHSRKIERIERAKSWAGLLEDDGKKKKK